VLISEIKYLIGEKLIFELCCALHYCEGTHVHPAGQALNFLILRQYIQVKYCFQPCTVLPGW